MEYFGVSKTESETTSDFSNSPITFPCYAVNANNNILYSLGSFCPNVPDGESNITTKYLGDDSHVWGGMRVHSGTQKSSDSRLKNSIIDIPEEYELFFDGLNPVSFKYNDGSSDRRHLGFIAQDVEKNLHNAGITIKDFAGICIGNDNNHTYSLRYEEFIPLNTLEIQKLKKRIIELENRLEQLENNTKEESYGTETTSNHS